LDLKSDNILLDAQLNAKVADFGLSRTLPQLNAVSQYRTARVCGTPGYVCPQFMQHGKVTTRTDCYSFGMVILEVLTGLRVMVAERKPPYLRWLVEDVYRSSGTISSVVDARCASEWPDTHLTVLALLSWSCSQEFPEARPTFQQMVRTLEQVYGDHSELSASDGSVGGGPAEAASADGAAGGWRM
jgi:serine/threonine protein kinase